MKRQRRARVIKAIHTKYHCDLWRKIWKNFLEVVLIDERALTICRVQG
jgi:hypothetical protein